MPTSPSWGSRKRCQGQLTQGQLTQVTQVKTGTTTLASNASYYPNGALAQFTYGNGIVHTMTQNARQLPSHSVDGSVLDLSTVFDENGNVAAITDNTASARQTRSMSYDGLDRLTATTSPMFGTASYAYDPQDNLTRVQVTGGSQPRDHYYCYNASNQLAFVRSGPNCTGTTSPAVIALAYDVQGNLSIKNGASYAFDFGNRLRTTAGQNYRYDAQGRRVRQDVAGSQLQYSQYAADGRLLWQRDETTNQRIANAYLAGSLLAEISRPLTGNTTTIRYLHTDALGSPIAKTSASGAIIETSEYEPYGRLLNRANDNRAGYTGHVMDAASGLTYMQQRYYDPQLGVFLSVDPVTAYEKPMTNFNRYAYARNNPYRFTDPDGRDSVGEMIDSGAAGCGAVSCAGWALANAAWKVFGAEGVSQIADKGWSNTSRGDRVGAVLEVASVIPFVKLAAGARFVAKEAVSTMSFGRSQLQHAFKHAQNFGVSGNANNRTLAAFQAAIQSHVSNVGTVAIQGTYRGSEVTHFVNASTGLNVMKDASGNFLSGWKLSAQQLEHVFKDGKLGGGQ